MRRKWIFALIFLVTSLAVAQGPGGTPPATDPASRALQHFQGGEYSLALNDYKILLMTDPGNGTYQKFAAEAALDCGEDAYALQTLRPSIVAHPDDWQAHALLARAYAQTSEMPDHKTKRDKEVEWLMKAHKENPTTPLGRMRDFLLESDTQEGGKVQFFPALTPWGPYHVHLIARVFDPRGQPGLRITLETVDTDQATFAKEHPAETAKGERGFSLDGYAPDQKGADGRILQTHYTYGFFVGQPTYDVLRQRVLEVVSGKEKPLSSRVGAVN